MIYGIDGINGTNDYGEGNGTWDNFDWNSNDTHNDGDSWTTQGWAEFDNYTQQWIFLDEDGIPDPNSTDLLLKSSST